MPNPFLTTSTLHRRWIFLAFLIALHLVFFQGPLTQLGRLLFLIHIGIGLLWQPFIQPKRRMSFLGTSLVVVFSGLLAYYLNWGILILWTMLLAGVVGGKVFLFPARWERVFHLLGLGYLATVTFTLLLPEFLATVNLAESPLREPVLYLAPAVFMGMALLPSSREAKPTEHAEIVDYVYGVMVFLLQAVIVLGSVSFALLFKAGYFQSLLVALALVAAVLLMLGLIWHPSSGFGGLGNALAQHVISIGLPLEDWIQSLAVLAMTEEDPERFLHQACKDLPERLPGVIGVLWETPGSSSTVGERNGRETSFTYGVINLKLVTRTTPSPTLIWHYDLVCRLLAEFYMGKWRAMELKRLSYIEAIHETGARLTHDVKNLLQTLDTLCIAAEREGATPSPRFNELLRRQLPEVAARLRQTLLKLSSPDQPEPAISMPADTWFAALKNRLAGSETCFEAGANLAFLSIPDHAMFSSIAENLLQNFNDKLRGCPGIAVTIRLSSHQGKPVLEVQDTGLALPEALARMVLHERVPSENGLGVGLYQCARLATSRGYRLHLAENINGCVRFRLEPAG